MEDDLDDSWLDSVKPVFKYFEERTPGTLVELQEWSITWHYGKADEDFGEVQAGDLQTHVEKVLANSPVEVLLGTKRVEVRPYGVSKGAIIPEVLEEMGYVLEDNEHDGPEALSDSDEDQPQPLDFVMVMGSFSARDEDLYTELNGRCDDYKDIIPKSANYTISVNQVPSKAEYTLADPKQIFPIMSQMAKVSRNHVGGGISPEDLTEKLKNAQHEIPSALGSFHRIQEMCKGKRVVFFLDYDGTLTPIVEHPDLATLDDSTREIVRAIAAAYTTAIVTGRTHAKARGFVQLDELYYAGSQGFDMVGPNDFKYQVADSYIPALQAIQVTLAGLLEGIKGMMIEDNTFSLSVHYRNVAVEEHKKVLDAVESALSEFPALRKTEGKMVFELRPAVDWHKGKAVEWLIDMVTKDHPHEQIIPIYIGDDTTDEDAFRALLPVGGIGIVVRDKPCTNRDTDAAFFLNDPTEVTSFLSKFVDAAN